MKPRIRTDVTLMLLLIPVTFIFWTQPWLYGYNPILDSCVFFLGLLLILKGILLRMAARGYKMKHSNQSNALVTDGPYSIVRNPMYLGTFLIGLGFVLNLWPLWASIIFAVLFVWRFSFQINREEQFLRQTFGLKYAEYCRRVPALIPSILKINQIKMRDVIDLNYAFKTKERNGLLWIFLIAVAFKILQQKIMYGIVYWPVIGLVVGAALVAFGLILIAKRYA